MAEARVATREGDKVVLPPCRVCGDQAAGFHYGVNTCEACKGFFHRSLRRHTEYKCRASRSSGYCEYRPGKRKSCQFCRYQKCLKAGMSKEAIKTGRYTYLKRTEDTQEIRRLRDLKHHNFTDKLNMSAMQVSSSFGYCSRLKNDTEFCDVNMQADSTTVDEYLVQPMTEEQEDHEFSAHKLTSAETTSAIASLILTKSHHQFNDQVLSCGRGGAQPIKAEVETTKLLRPSSLHTLTSLLSASDNTQSDPESHQEYIFKNEIFSSKYIFNKSNPLEEQSETIKIKPIHSVSHTPSQQKRCSKEVSGSHLLNESFTGSNSLFQSMDLNACHSSDSCTPSFITDKLSSNHSSDSCTSSFIIDKLSSSDSCTSSFITDKLSSRNSKGQQTSLDVFPDISFCMVSSQQASPSSLVSLDDSSKSPVSSSLSSSPATSFMFKGDNTPYHSPLAAVPDIDSSQTVSPIGESCGDTGLCETQGSHYPLETDDSLVVDDDNVALQIMEEYTHGLDIIIDRLPIKEIRSSSVQTLLTSPSSPGDFLPVSPDSLPTVATCQSTIETSVIKAVKNMRLSNISDLYTDMDAVISTLIMSHKENIGDFSHLSKEEMLDQQRAHFESCELKKQNFGNLGFLTEQEYDDIYSITGIDVDNRRLILQKYLNRMERCVRGLVQFAKVIPGFSLLDINTQVELIKLARSEIALFTVYPTVNLELGVSLGLTGEHWACLYDMGKLGYHIVLSEYMVFCDKLQKLALSQEEEVLLKAIVVVSTDRDSSVKSPLAEAIRWQLILCLKHSLEKHRQKPSMVLARYILALTQSRTVAENFKDFLRQLKMKKYSSIEQNPLLLELFSGILQEKEGEQNWDQLCQLVGQGTAGMWTPCLLGDPVTF